MKVVHLYKDYHPPTVGGIEQTVERIATGMARRGIEVTVLTSHPGSRRTVDETTDGVRVIRCGEWARALSTPFCPSMPAALAGLEADVVHLHYPSPPGEVSWLAARPRGALVVNWYCDIVRQRAVLPVYGHVIRAVLRAADAVMTIYDGQAAKSSFLRHHQEKVRVVPLGIDLEDFCGSLRESAPVAELRARLGGGPLVAFVGRLVPYKGLDVLIEAMRTVEARCLIIGGGPQAARLQEQARRAGLQDKVRFTGRLERGDLLTHMAAADVGVLPSVSVQEAYGLAMAEMMAFGVPVVCTDVGTGTTFVNPGGITGLVVPPCDPAALARALQQLVCDEALRQRLGHAARERAHRLFSTDAMMQGILSVYEDAIAAQARRRG